VWGILAEKFIYTVTQGLPSHFCLSLCWYLPLKREKEDRKGMGGQAEKEDRSFEIKNKLKRKEKKRKEKKRKEKKRKEKKRKEKKRR
jgi:hypothetical protein